MAAGDSGTGSDSTSDREVLKNGGFESLSSWDCWSPVHCDLTSTARSGQHAVKVTGRQESWQGPTQFISVQPSHQYHVSAYVKLLNDHGKGQLVAMTLDFHYTDDTNHFIQPAGQNNVRTSSNWVHLSGTFTTPDKAIKETRVYFEGPEVSVDFLVDDASVTEVGGGGNGGGGQTSLPAWRRDTDRVINERRKNDIHIRVTRAGGINAGDVQIRVVQTKKSFPFGMALSAQRYNENAGNGKYRAFVHNYFNWAVPGNALKWYSIERYPGDRNFKPALDMIHGLRSHGIKVRGHNLIWDVENTVQNWVKQLSGDPLRQAVKHHIEDTMSVTKGLLENWDVNNENMHGHWYEDRLHDPDYNLEIFRIAHNADPSMKLFLNEYNVVSNGEATDRYLAQAKQVKAASVGLYAIGAQCHFASDRSPDPAGTKERLDKLATAGLPIWATEVDVTHQDENVRADYYETALRILYGHPAVEGILLWGFWDQNHWRGEKACLVKGDNMEITAAGRRVIDLLENQWMTDETHVLSQSGDTFTVRGFHGDYELRVIYKGRDLGNLKKTFTLGKRDMTVDVRVQV